MFREKLGGVSWMILTILLIMFPTCSYAGVLADPIATALERLATENFNDQAAITRVFRNLDITSKSKEDAFVEKIQQVAKTHNLDPEMFETKLRQILDKKRFEKIDYILEKVYGRYGKDLDVVVRTGSSGIRYLELAGKRQDHAGYRLLFSDDDISFVGKKAVHAAKYFNQLVEQEGLEILKVKGFDIVHLKNIRGIDLHMLNLLEQEKFVGEAAMSGIKKEMLIKGAVIAENEGGKLLPHAESLSSFVKNKASSILADELNEKLTREAVRKYGAMTMVGSCERQITKAHGGWEKLSDPEKVKYVLRQRIALDESGALKNLEKLNSVDINAQLEKLKGLKLKEKLTEKEVQWLQKLRVSNVELVFEEIPYKLNPIATKARASGRSLAGNPEVRKALDELTAGFVLMQEHVFDVSEPEILRKIREMAGGSQDIYKMLFTSFNQGKELMAELDAWVKAGLSRESFVELLLKAETHLARLELIKARRAALQAGSTEVKTLKEVELATSSKEGDRFLLRLLKGSNGQKLFIGVLGAVGGAVVYKEMHNAWASGNDQWDLSDAAFSLIDFVPGGMSFKRVGIEGLDPGIVFSFVKEYLYFSPAWPLVLVGDMAVLSVDMHSAFSVQYNQKGLVKLLVYAGEYTNDFHFIRLNLPKAAANENRIIEKDQLPVFLFSTKTVVVPVSGKNNTYRISNLSKVSEEILDQIFLENDPVTQQLRKAADQQLTDISHDKSYESAEDGNDFAGMFEYAKWMTGFSTICQKSPEKWCRVFNLLKIQIEKRRDVVMRRIMIPTLIQQAEKEYSAWTMGNKPPVAELASIQKKLEELRNEPLTINLAQEVGKRANEVEKKAADTRETLEQQKLRRGEYWQAALKAYETIYQQHTKLGKDIVSKLNISENDIRNSILRFPWTGDYKKDAENAQSSRVGFALGERSSWDNVKKIKKATPNPFEESIDQKALIILSEVQFRWRKVLDSTGYPKDDVNSSKEFVKKHQAALIKVKALYGKAMEFQTLIEKAARIEYGKLHLGEQTPFAIRFLSDQLKTLQDKNLLRVIWRSPHGDFGSGGRGGKVNFTTTRLLPATVEAIIQDQRDPTVKGILSVEVPVEVPKGLFYLTIKPDKPKAGEFVRAEVKMPDRYINAYNFHYKWWGKGCRIEGGDRFHAVVTAPKYGEASVFVRITAAYKGEKNHVIASDKVVFKVEKGRLQHPSELTKTVPTGEERKNEKVTGEGQDDSTIQSNQSAEARARVESEPASTNQAASENGVEAGEASGNQERKVAGFAGTVPNIWEGESTGAGFSFHRKEAFVKIGTDCSGATTNGSVSGKFDGFGPHSKQEVLKQLQERSDTDSEITPFSMDDFAGYLLETKGIEHHKGYYSGTGFVDERAIASGDGWVVNGQQAIHIRYSVGAHGCYDNRYRSFLMSQTAAAQSEARSILSGVHLVEGNGGFAKIPYNGPKLDGSDMLRVNLTAFPERPSFLGEQVEITAKASGGKPPYSYKWTGNHGGKGATVLFGSQKAGDYKLSVEVRDSKNTSATAEITIHVEAVDVKVTRTSPQSSQVVIGTPVHFKAEIDGGGKSPLEILWQPHPEVAFDPFEKSPVTTAVFTTPGIHKVWAQIFLIEGKTRKTVGESEQLEVEVIQPQIRLTADKPQPYVGERVTLAAEVKPAVKNDVISFWWELKGNAMNKGALSDPQKYSFIPKDTKPITVTVHAKAKNGGADLGEKSIQIAAKKYGVSISKPKRLDKAPWKWDPIKGTAVELPQAIAVFQNAEVHCTITPKPKGKIRYQWTVNPKGAVLSAPGSRSTNINAHKKGTYQIFVTVKDKNGTILGTATRTYSVTVSQRDLDVARQKAEDQQKAQKLLQESRQLWNEGNLQQAIAKGIQAQKLAGKDETIAKTLTSMQHQKKAIDDTLEKSDQFIGQGNFTEARKALEKAGLISTTYPRYTETAEKLALFEKRAAVKKALAEEKLKQKKAQVGQLIADARRQEESKDLKAALEKYRQAQQLEPTAETAAHISKIEQQIKNAEKLLQKSRELWNEGNLQQAIAKGIQAQKLAGKDETIAKTLTSMQHQKKAIDDTLEKSDQFIGQGKFKEAKSALKKAEFINTKYPRCTKTAGKLALSEKRAAAEKALAQEKLRQKEEQKKARVEQLIADARRLEESRDLKAAVEKYRQVQQLEPTAEVAARISEIEQQLNAQPASKQNVSATLSEPLNQSASEKNQTKGASTSQTSSQNSKEKAETPTAKNSTGNTSGGYWQLVEEKGSIGRECSPKEVYNDYYRDTVSGFGGHVVITKMIREGNQVYCKLEGQWQRPPEKLYPGRTINLPVTLHRLADSGKYSCDMAVAFDLWDMECGSSGSGGDIGDVELDRKGPKSLSKEIPWKVNEPFHKKAGEKLTIRACYSGANICGKNQGMKYYYQWMPGGSAEKTSLVAKENAAVGRKTTKISGRPLDTKMAAGKTITSTSYTPNNKGDVFKGGHWAGASGGSDWLEIDFTTPQMVTGVYIGEASTDITTNGFKLVLKLKKPDGKWATIDELHDTNINRTALSGGAVGKSIPPYTKKMSQAIKATAFRLEFYGHGWFDATDIRIYTDKTSRGKESEAIKKAEREQLAAGNKGDVPKIGQPIPGMETNTTSKGPLPADKGLRRSQGNRISIENGQDSLRIPSSIFEPGEKIAVSFTASPNYPEKSWIGMFNADLPHNGMAKNNKHELSYQYLKKKQRGTFSFTSPIKEGAYDFRMFDHSSGKEVATIKFSVVVDKDAARILLPKTVFEPEEKIKLKFTASPNYPEKSWIGMFKADLPHNGMAKNNKHELAYQYLKKSPNGVFTFTSPTAEGVYDFRMFEHSNGKEVATIKFSVAVDKDAASLTLPKKVFEPGEKIAVSFTASSNYPGKSWIGMFKADLPHNGMAKNNKHELAYQYLEKKQKGTFTFTSPEKEGAYDFRMFEHSNGKEVATIKFTVSAVNGTQVSSKKLRVSEPKSAVEDGVSTAGSSGSSPSSSGRWVLYKKTLIDGCSFYDSECYPLKSCSAKEGSYQVAVGYSTCGCDTCGGGHGSGTYTVPPAVLSPGETITLSVSATGDGYSSEYACFYNTSKGLTFTDKGSASIGPDWCKDIAKSSRPNLLSGEFTIQNGLNKGGVLLIQGGGSIGNAQTSMYYYYLYRWQEQ